LPAKYNKMQSRALMMIKTALTTTTITIIIIIIFNAVLMVFSS